MNWKLGLNLYSSKLMLFNPSDLKKNDVKTEIENEKYHIYLICKRKKIHYEKTEIEENIGYTTLFYLDDNFNKEYLRCSHPLDLLKINGIKNGVFNIDCGEEKNIEVKDQILINSFYVIPDDIEGTTIKKSLPTDLEVMYVGQAFGRKKNKKIDYRIAKHEKIQKIALEILDNSSNEEVLIIGVKIDVNDLSTSIVEFNSQTKKPTLESIFDLRDKASQRITPGQEITIFEASLINYFKPKFNEKYKSKFPSTDFTSIDEIYKTDFDYSAMTLDTKPVRIRVFSDKIKEPKYIHSMHFPLKTKRDKKSFYEYLKEN
mgnify:CR=1 FL=1